MSFLLLLSFFVVVIGQFSEHVQNIWTDRQFCQPQCSAKNDVLILAHRIRAEHGRTSEFWWEHATKTPGNILTHLPGTATAAMPSLQWMQAVTPTDSNLAIQIWPPPLHIVFTAQCHASLTLPHSPSESKERLLANNILTQLSCTATAWICQPCKCLHCHLISSPLLDTVVSLYTLQQCTMLTLLCTHFLDLSRGDRKYHASLFATTATPLGELLDDDENLKWWYKSLTTMPLLHKTGCLC